MPWPDRWVASSSPLRYLRAWAFHGRALGSTVMPEESTIHSAIRSAASSSPAAARGDQPTTSCPGAPPGAMTHTGPWAARAVQIGSRSWGLAVVSTTGPSQSRTLGTIRLVVLPDPLGPNTTADTQSLPARRRREARPRPATSRHRRPAGSVGTARRRSWARVAHRAGSTLCRLSLPDQLRNPHTPDEASTRLTAISRVQNSHGAVIGSACGYAVAQARRTPWRPSRPTRRGGDSAN